MIGAATEIDYNAGSPPRQAAVLRLLHYRQVVAVGT